jgi:uncharacterized membrane protein YciS (DUF1049 family)
MKILKWGLVFAVAFAAAWVLLFTFTQEPFKEVAPVNLVFTQTPEFPMYTFAVGTFAIGLLIGFFVAAYYYIAGQAGIRSKKKDIRGLEELIREKDGEIEKLRADGESRRNKDLTEIRKLEDAVRETDDEIEKVRAARGQAREENTKSMKSVGEKDLFT